MLLALVKFVGSPDADAKGEARLLGEAGVKTFEEEGRLKDDEEYEVARRVIVAHGIQDGEKEDDWDEDEEEEEEDGENDVPFISVMRRNKVKISGLQMRAPQTPTSSLLGAGSHSLSLSTHREKENERDFQSKALQINAQHFPMRIYPNLAT
jgi:hypothetical protein